MITFCLHLVWRYLLRLEILRRREVFLRRCSLRAVACLEGLGFFRVWESVYLILRFTDFLDVMCQCPQSGQIYSR